MQMCVRQPDGVPGFSVRCATDDFLSLDTGVNSVGCGFSTLFALGEGGAESKCCGKCLYQGHKRAMYKVGVWKFWAMRYSSRVVW